jgi:hypothetical protein
MNPARAHRQELPVEISEDVLTGWRCWFVLPEEGRLRPVYMRGLRWGPGHAQEATCARRMHPAPDEGCACGVYAVFHPLLLEEVQWLDQTPPDVERIPGVLVVGQVALWGKVVQHERGWRAQFAYPTHLYAFTHDEALVDGLRQDYQVPVTAGLEADRLWRMLPPRQVPTPKRRRRGRKLRREELLAITYSSRWPAALQQRLAAVLDDLAISDPKCLPARRPPDLSAAALAALSGRRAAAQRWLWGRLVRWHRLQVEQLRRQWTYTSTHLRRRQGRLERGALLSGRRLTASTIHRLRVTPGA